MMVIVTVERGGAKMSNDLISRKALVKELLVERNKHPAVIDGTPIRFNQAMRGGIHVALRQVEQAPAVDAVFVVRCKNCKHFKYGDYCAQDKMEHSKCRPDDFCSYGEVRDADEQLD